MKIRNQELATTTFRVRSVQAVETQFGGTAYTLELVGSDGPLHDLVVFTRPFGTPRTTDTEQKLALLKAEGEVPAPVERRGWLGRYWSRNG